MQMVKNILVVGLLVGCLFGLHAKEHVITSVDSSVKCSLRPFSNAQMTNLIALDQGDGEKLINNFTNEKCERYMAVEVVVENNGPDTIILGKDCYLDGLDEFLVSKELFCSLYRDSLDRESRKRWQGLLWAIPQGVLAGFFGWRVVNTLIRIGGANILGGLFCLLFLERFVSNSIDGIEGARNIARISETKQGILNNTFRLDREERRRVRYSPTAQYYEIQPGRMFHDLFFIDLHAEGASRDLLDYDLKLIYR